MKANSPQTEVWGYTNKARRAQAQNSLLCLVRASEAPAVGEAKP